MDIYEPCLTQLRGKRASFMDGNFIPQALAVGYERVPFLPTKKYGPFEDSSSPERQATPSLAKSSEKGIQKVTRRMIKDAFSPQISRTPKSLHIQS